MQNNLNIFPQQLYPKRTTDLYVDITGRHRGVVRLVRIGEAVGREDDAAAR